MKKMQEKSKQIQIYKVNHKLPPQRSKTRRIEGFGENVGQLPLCVNKLHLYLSLLNMLPKKVVSQFNVFGSPLEN
jgi:hypothetical protein